MSKKATNNSIRPFRSSLEYVKYFSPHPPQANRHYYCFHLCFSLIKINQDRYRHCLVQCHLLLFRSNPPIPVPPAGHGACFRTLSLHTPASDWLPTARFNKLLCWNQLYRLHLMSAAANVIPGAHVCRPPSCIPAGVFLLPVALFRHRLPLISETRARALFSKN